MALQSAFNPDNWRVRSPSRSFYRLVFCNGNISDSKPLDQGSNPCQPAMRIISDFHDYYDCIQGLGQDQTVVYLRKRETIGGWQSTSKANHYSVKWQKSLTNHRIIGFCGKIIPMIELYVTEDAKPCRCWSIEDVDKFMQNSLSKGQLRAYRSTRWTRGFSSDRRRHLFEAFFINSDRRQNNYECLFRKHHVPIFVVGGDRQRQRIVLNACLKRVEFYTQFDNFRAFQEISMYMGGVLGTHGGHKTKYKGEPMSSEVSDRDLLIAKGFDKHSFRSSG